MEHTKEFFEELVRNDLHTLPEAIQQETIEKLMKYDNPKLTTKKVKNALRKIKEKYEEVQVEGGDSVGIIAAQSLGEPSTQMILRTFHYAGVMFEHTTGGLQRVQEITNAVRNIRHPKMKIVLDGTRSCDAVLKEIQEIKGIKVATVSKERDVIYTEGSNLEEVLCIKGVDTKRTTTNNVREIEEVLGIEAARQSIIEQLYDVYVSEGLEIDIRHIILIADMMTVDGEVRSLNRIGVMKKKTSPIMKMTFEETMNVLYRTAQFGITEELKGVNENIVVGVPINRGTGSRSIRLEFNNHNNHSSVINHSTHEK